MIETLPPHTPVIDPTAYVHSAAVVIGEVEIGAQSSIWPGAVLRGDDGLIRIGSQTSVQDGTVVHTTAGKSRSIVGDRVTIGHNAIIHGAVVDDDVIVGMGAILLDNAHIGSHVIVGAGALVPMGKRVPDGVLIVGSPFRIVRELTDEDRGWIDYSWRTYVERTERFKSTLLTVEPGGLH
jgi:carbonic anhydrase/acetyltransferase-like protein (isoleucine patch superfamily)